jgi:hypothetical protein
MEISRAIHSQGYLLGWRYRDGMRPSVSPVLGRAMIRITEESAARTIPISGFAELALELLSERFSLPSRAVALDKLSGARKGVVFSGVITDAHEYIKVERTYCYGARRFQRVVHG